MGKNKSQKTVLWEKELDALGRPFPDALDHDFRRPSDDADDFATPYARAIEFAAELGDTWVARLWQQALTIGFRAGMTEGYKGGFHDGKREGRELGSSEGREEGEIIGFERGKAEGLKGGLSEGKRLGFVAGREFGEKQAAKMSKTATPDLPAAVLFPSISLPSALDITRTRALTTAIARGSVVFAAPPPAVTGQPFIFGSGRAVPQPPAPRPARCPRLKRPLLAT